MVNRKIDYKKDFSLKLKEIRKYNNYFADQINIWILDISTKNDLSKLGIGLGEKFYLDVLNIIII